MKPVMIVDDNLDILDAMQQLLLSDGIETIAAADGVEAIRSMDSGKIPCVILLDNAMPVMNGVQFLDVMRRNPRFAKIPVYIISASGDFDGSISAAGIQGFIHKPFDPVKVLEIVRRHCVDRSRDIRADASEERSPPHLPPGTAYHDDVSQETNRPPDVSFVWKESKQSLLSLLERARKQGWHRMGQPFESEVEGRKGWAVWVAITIPD